MIVYDQGKYIYIPTMVGPLLTLLQLIASQIRKDFQKGWVRGGQYI